MKVTSLDNKYSSVNFRGIGKIKNSRGESKVVFFYPFDSENYNCYLELHPVYADKNYQYKISPDNFYNFDTGESEVKLEKGTNEVNLTRDYGLGIDEKFAYRYKIVNKKNPNDISYGIDPGEVISDGSPNGRYNMSSPSNLNMMKGGSMKLVIPDSYNPKYVYDSENEIHEIPNIRMGKFQKAVKTFSNQMGGSLAGIEHDLDDGKFDSYSRILSTPICAGKCYGYWTNDNVQISLDIANINAYQSFIRKLFIKDKNFVADAAMVNEGLNGVHFQNVLKYGKESPFYYWFKISNPDYPLKLGVFSEKTDFIGARIVNSKYKYIQNEHGIILKRDNHNKYDKKKPTYFQIYDKRLATKEQLSNSQKLIDSYQNFNTKNVLDINTHNDTVVPYYFVINPETFDRTVDRINDYNKERNSSNRININNYRGIRLLAQFNNFNLDKKIDGGFDTWDANPDIAKLNYVFSNSDYMNNKNYTKEERLALENKQQRYVCEARDYAMSAGKYWTEKTKNTLLIYIAQQLKGIKHSNDPDEVYNYIINKTKETRNNIDEPKLPLSLRTILSEEIIKNILDKTYKLPNTDVKYLNSDLIVGPMMDFPLDSIEFGDDITAALSSHFISKRASRPEQIGKSRYEMYKTKNRHLRDDNRELYYDSQSMYENHLYFFAKDILNRVNSKLLQSGCTPLYGSGNSKYDFERRVLPIVMPEIVKYAVIKGLVPNATCNIDSKTGEISYAYNELKNIHLKDVGVSAPSPEGEASQLINKIKRGTIKIAESDREQLAQAVYLSLKGTKPVYFDIAKVIVDKTMAGLDWRIDATKDVADIESIRNNEGDFEHTWNDVIDFWSIFTKGIRKQNPNSYIVAEITDEDNLFDIGDGKFSHYNRNGIIPKFLDDTKINSTANYSYFFSTIAKMFNRSNEYEINPDMSYGDIKKAVFDKLAKNERYGEISPYLKSAPLDGLVYSYNFIGNHDKPRMLHCLALDMNLFFGNLNNPVNKDIREKAYRIINDKFYGVVSDSDINNQDFSCVSSKACAMAWMLKSAFGKAIDYEYKDNPEKRSQIYKTVLKSISDLANGIYKGRRIEADGFGVKPIDVTINLVIEQAMYEYGLAEILKDGVSPDFARQKHSNIINKTFEYALNPAISKLKGMMNILVALPGIPTMFAGDDLASTGYEEKTKNVYQQNRNIVHNEYIDKSDDNYKYKEFVKEHYVEFNKIMGVRENPKLHSMNDGTPFILQEQFDKNNNEISALLRQSNNGDMAISLFNLNSTKNDDYYLTPEESYYPGEVKLDQIYLDRYPDKRQKYDEMPAGLPRGIRVGTIFKNPDVENEKYIVRYADENNKTGYKLVKIDENGNEIPITITGTTLNLYHLNNVPSFGSRKILYNPQYNFVSDPYKCKKSCKNGDNLNIISE